MALHRLASITIGVPNVEETARYYAEFGLTRDGARFSTSDGGEQLRIVEAPSRRLIELLIGADDPDDLDRIADGLAKLGVPTQRDPASVSAVEIHSGARVVCADPDYLDAVDSIRERKIARAASRAATVACSSAVISREYPTTSAARIAASRCLPPDSVNSVVPQRCVADGTAATVTVGDTIHREGGARGRRIVGMQDWEALGAGKAHAGPGNPW